MADFNSLYEAVRRAKTIAPGLQAGIQGFQGAVEKSREQKLEELKAELQAVQIRQQNAQKERELALGEAGMSLKTIQASTPTSILKPGGDIDTMQGISGLSYSPGARTVAPKQEDVYMGAGKVVKGHSSGIQNPLLAEAENRRNKQFVFKVADRFETLPEVKKARSAVGEFDNLKGLIESNSPISAASIPTFMARFSGEVGNLSEADKAPFGGTRAILPRLNQVMDTWSKGTLTPENQNYLLTFISTVKNSRLKTLRERAQGYSAQQGKLYGSKQFGDDLYSALDVGIEDVQENLPAAAEQEMDVTKMSDEELMNLAR